MSDPTEIEETPAQLAPQPAPKGAHGFDLLQGVEVEITLEIGRRRMTIGEVLALTAGETVELSKAAGEPIDIYINDQLLGVGEAVVVGDRYGVRITELYGAQGAA